MAPSSGAVIGILARTLKQARAAWQKASRAVEQLPKQVQQATAQAEPIYIRNAPKHPLHPAAALRQSQGRWYTTHAAIKSNAGRNFSTTTTVNAAPSRTPRSAFPRSRAGDAVRQLPGTARAPFASTLRPNLTGGTFGRTAGGYSRGGGARFFSHTPAAQAQVVQNVSQAVRAFLIGGHKAQFDGVDGHGNKRFRAVTALQKEASSTLSTVPRATPGSFVDFSVNPTITALTPLSSIAGYPAAAASASAYAQPTGLHSTGFLDVLSADFSRALKDLSVILNDFRALSSLGDLPITYDSEASTLRVHFPGCDAGFVERLCDELGVRRGIVGQDEDFDAFAGTEVALLFPFAPSKTVSECEFFERPVERRHHYARQEVPWQDMMSDEGASTEELSTRSQDGLEEEEDSGYEAVGRLGESNPWMSSPSGYESVEGSHLISVASEKGAPLEFQGFEGLYRFMEMCDESR